MLGCSGDSCPDRCSHEPAARVARARWDPTPQTPGRVLGQGESPLASGVFPGQGCVCARSCECPPLVTTPRPVEATGV